MQSYDLIVVGSGPAGQRAGIQAAKAGKKVALIEKREVIGGVCINTGTIPSKTMREAVLVWKPLRERAIALFAETVDGEMPRPDGNGVSGGWPGTKFPDGFTGLITA